MGHLVKISNTGTVLDCGAGVTILEAALDAGVAYPHGCQSGNCGACKSNLLDGTVDMEGYSEFALMDEERDRGLILACRAVPDMPCEVAWLDEDDLIVHPRRILSTTVTAIDDVTHDIKRVLLDVNSGGPFTFSAGQFASVSFEGAPARDYSMANRPDDRQLEFHIRRMPGGNTSAHVANNVKVGDKARVEGPFGTSYLRESHRGPILAIAGGSGLAPIKSIVEHALARKLPQHIHLYFGVRNERDLYLEQHFTTLAAANPTLHFVPVLSEPGGATSRRTGLVHEIVGRDFDDVDGCKAYVAGPPVMVEAATKLLTARGMRRIDVHADAFYTAAEMQAAGKKTGAQM
ncbi:2Fe-2S iron-sulfur cluster-binding protein [Reyranella sp. CPCC 100927]|uniref:2Fe-2S iron-sulfur cluster-binding protein n=1 Tax=Reyranella sp. CPCC 100927 TaxID=2599616 RepID=UPI0021067B1A|nr:2Fe-2S iron-sulfur cluster-binding protein [Reyranella sp. CPCC 100927]